MKTEVTNEVEKEAIRRALSNTQEEFGLQDIDSSDCNDCGGEGTVELVKDHEVFLETPLDQEPRSLMVNAYVCSDCGNEAYDKETTIRILEATDNLPYIKYLETEPNILTRTILH
jgi:hypothetical protein